MPLPQITAEFARYAATDPLCCPSSRVTVRYRADISDLRAPVNAQWTGVTQPNGLSASVFFTRAGRENIGVTVTDADGLSDSATVTVRVSVIPLEDGQQPF